MAALPTRLQARQKKAMAALIDQASDDVLAVWVRARADLQKVLETRLQAGLDVSSLLWARRYITERLTDAAIRTANTAAKAVTTLTSAGVTDAAALVAAQLPAGWAPATPPAPNIDAIVARTAAVLAERSWNIAQDVQERIWPVLVEGVTAGRNPHETARRITAAVGDALDGGTARALTIARTETVDAYRAAAQVSHDANADVLEGWMWLASLAARTCPSCVAMHGTVHDLDEPGPLDHPSGRCSRMPVVKPWRELGVDLPDTRPQIETGVEWFARQPETVQRDILGPGRFEAHRRGDYPTDLWAVRRQNPGWRDDYRPAPIRAAN